MAARIYAAESMLYRTIGLIDDMMKSLDTRGPYGGRVIADGIEEYAIECSLNKVFGTEVLAYVADEGVQIHGGYGFMSEYPIERLYRDARIFRIFEGTNEINRTLILSMLMRREAKGSLPLRGAIDIVKKKIGSGIPERKGAADLVQAAKEIFLFSSGIVLEKFEKDLVHEQEVLGRIADLAIWTFAMESAWLRTQKAIQRKGEHVAGLKVKMTEAFVYDTIQKISMTAMQILAAVATGEEWRGLSKHLAALIQYPPIDFVTLNRSIASDIFEAGKYIV
jgi:alkylation response protein AidB-like acyl-CoA dehydrogenase